MAHEDFTVDLTLRSGYRFEVDFDLEEVPELTVDEGPPLGEGEGPNAARMLAAAVGQCMSSSLLFCLKRARVEIDELHTRVHGRMVRNEQGRLRIGGLRVQIEPAGAPEQIARMARCLEIFEDFCTVGESVRQGIPVEVEVQPLVPAA